MTAGIDDTHRPDLQSWIEAANSAVTDFPIQNLPLGCFRAAGGARPGVAIGDRIVDLCVARTVLDLDARILRAIDACAAQGALNPLLALGHVDRVRPCSAWRFLRAQLGLMCRHL